MSRVAVCVKHCSLSVTDAPRCFQYVYVTLPLSSCMPLVAPPSPLLQCILSLWQPPICLASKNTCQGLLRKQKLRICLPPYLRNADIRLQTKSVTILNVPPLFCSMMKANPLTELRVYTNHGCWGNKRFQVPEWDVCESLASKADWMLFGKGFFAVRGPQRFYICSCSVV